MVSVTQKSMVMREKVDRKDSVKVNESNTESTERLLKACREFSKTVLNNGKRS